MWSHCKWMLVTYSPVWTYPSMFLHIILTKGSVLLILVIGGLLSAVAPHGGHGPDGTCTILSPAVKRCPSDEPCSKPQQQQTNRQWFAVPPSPCTLSAWLCLLWLHFWCILSNIFCWELKWAVDLRQVRDHPWELWEGWLNLGPCVLFPYPVLRRTDKETDPKSYCRVCYFTRYCRLGHSELWVSMVINLHSDEYS